MNTNILYNNIQKMNKLIVFLLLIIIPNFAFSQSNKVKSEILSQQEIEKIFTPATKTQLNILFPVRRIYRYEDRSGQYLLVLTESADRIVKEETFHHKIKAINFRLENKELVQQWEINDFITKQENDYGTENSIWFWTKYIELNDLDNDQLIDPIIVYGSSAENSTSDGRIKILIYYKGQKFAIRHQNGILDDERNTQVDKAYYSLPQKIKINVKKIMDRIKEDQNGIFPNGWQEAMKKQKTKFDEN